MKKVTNSRAVKISTVNIYIFWNKTKHCANKAITMVLVNIEIYSYAGLKHQDRKDTNLKIGYIKARWEWSLHQRYKSMFPLGIFFSASKKKEQERLVGGARTSRNDATEMVQSWAGVWELQRLLRFWSCWVGHKIRFD